MALEHTDSSLFIGSPHLRLKRISSTNAYALEYISKSNPTEGTVISASFQYAGKGQIGRFWESEDGKNITCSSILRPTFLMAHDQFYLNMAISLALADFVDIYLADFSQTASIKWPNDIYINDKKIAGILIQNSIVGKYLNTSVIGTGININQVSFSSELPNPTSLKKVLKRDLELEEVFQQLFNCLTNRYSQLKDEHKRGVLHGLRKAYLDRMYRRNVWSDFHTEEGIPFSGKILEVDDIGRLKIQLKNGDIRLFSFREIKFVI